MMKDFTTISRASFRIQTFFCKTLILIYLSVFSAVYATADDFAARNIPDNLLKNAMAVIRQKHTTITVKSLQNATITDRTVITILNKDGRDFGHFAETYDQNQQFKSIRAEVYDQAGNRISRLKPSDVSDNSFVSGASIFEDTRIKTFEIHQSSYPYTVLIEYEKEYQGFIGFPTWIPQFADDLSVQEASLSLVFPEGNPVRFKTMNMSDPVKSTNEGQIHFTWQIKNLEARKDEPQSVPAYEYLPLVYISPDNFFFHNTRGNFQTWSNYGDWVVGLLVGQQTLPDNVMLQIKELTADIQDNPREKAKRIYRFMQNHTRYVSIQLGLGGFQPLPAGTVLKTGYGDCKALSNYTMALLKVAGVESYYAEIGAGDKKIRFDDFPSPDQTNHAILCVPFENDTVWLECTSQRYPFGFVPRSLMYRKALVIKAKGSKLVDMPSPDGAKNTMELNMKIDLDESGNAQASVHNTYKGIQMETIFPEVWQSEKEQYEALHSRYGIPGIKILDFSLALIDEDELFATETLNASINSLAAKTGNRLFLSPNPLAPLNNRWSTLSNRQTDFEINIPYNDHTTIIYNIPEALEPENIPGKVILDTPYGTYNLSIEVIENKIVVQRELSLHRGRYSAKQYNDYVGFRQAIYRADRNQIILVAR